jgi:hypothetical protein
MHPILMATSWSWQEAWQIFLDSQHGMVQAILALGSAMIHGIPAPP